MMHYANISRRMHHANCKIFLFTRELQFAIIGHGQNLSIIPPSPFRQPTALADQTARRVRLSHLRGGDPHDLLLQPMRGPLILRRARRDRTVAQRHLFQGLRTGNHSLSGEKIVSRTRRSIRPSDPMELARKRAAERTRATLPAEWGIDKSKLALTMNADVEVKMDLAGRVARARRLDVFDTLSARGRLSPEALSAVRRLQNDVAVLHRTLSGGVDFAPRVDRSINPDAFTDGRRLAGGRIQAVLALAGPATARLLAALCEPELVGGAPADWRAIVARETGETLPDAQGALLRMACENLAGAYGVLARQAAQSSREAI